MAFNTYGPRNYADTQLSEPNEDTHLSAIALRMAVESFKRSGVVSGVTNECAITYLGPANPNELTWQVNTGRLRKDGVGYIISATQNVTLSAGGAQPRWDLICYDTGSGTMVVVQGTPASQNAVIPSPDQDDRLPLHAIFVPSGTTTFPSGGGDQAADHVQDLRVFLRDPVGFENVVDYGAVASATVNNSPAFQAAVDAAGAGGGIFIPDGDWGLGTTIQTPTPFTVMGMGGGGLLAESCTILRPLATLAGFVLDIGAQNADPNGATKNGGGLYGFAIGTSSGARSLAGSGVGGLPGVDGIRCRAWQTFTIDDVLVDRVPGYGLLIHNCLEFQLRRFAANACGTMGDTATASDTGAAGIALTGTVTLNATTAVEGAGTSFTTELQVGDTIRVSGQDRRVATITDNDSLTVTAAFTASGAGLSAVKTHTRTRTYFGNFSGIAGKNYTPDVLNGAWMYSSKGGTAVRISDTEKDANSVQYIDHGDVGADKQVDDNSEVTIIFTKQAAAGSTTTKTLFTTADADDYSFVDDMFNGWVIQFLSGTANLQCAYITDSAAADDSVSHAALAAAAAAADKTVISKPAVMIAGLSTDGIVPVDFEWFGGGVLSQRGPVIYMGEASWQVARGRHYATHFEGTSTGGISICPVSMVWCYDTLDMSFDAPNLHYLPRDGHISDLFTQGPAMIDFVARRATCQGNAVGPNHRISTLGVGSGAAYGIRFRESAADKCFGNVVHTGHWINIAGLTALVRNETNPSSVVFENLLMPQTMDTAYTVLSQSASSHMRNEHTKASAQSNLGSRYDVPGTYTIVPSFSVTVVPDGISDVLVCFELTVSQDTAGAAEFECRLVKDSSIMLLEKRMDFAAAGQQQMSISAIDIAATGASHTYEIQVRQSASDLFLEFDGGSGIRMCWGYAKVLGRSS